MIHTTTATAAMREAELGMSNFDHDVDDGFEQELRKSPAAVFGRHAGWNFNGRVWFDGESFCEEVWVYGVIQGIVKSDSLKELMKEVNDTYGWD